MERGFKIMNFATKVQNAVPLAMYQLECANIHVGNIDRVKVNNRLTACFGRTSYNRMTDVYTIEISGLLEKSTDEKNGLMDTLIHELLHTCKDSWKHTGEWKANAERMNKLYGYNIKRTASFEECGIKREEVQHKKRGYKYIVYCPECGYEWRFKTACDKVKHPHLYRCGRCKCELEVKEV